MEKCPLCEADLGRTYYSLKRGNYTLTAPASYCPKCGEVWDDNPEIAEYFEQLMGLADKTNKDSK